MSRCLQLLEVSVRSPRCSRLSSLPQSCKILDGLVLIYSNAYSSLRGDEEYYVAPQLLRKTCVECWIS